MRAMANRRNTGSQQRVRRNPEEEVDKDNLPIMRQWTEPPITGDKNPAIYVIPVNAWVLNRVVAMTNSDLDNRGNKYVYDELVVRYYDQPKDFIDYAAVRLTPDHNLTFQQRSGVTFTDSKQGMLVNNPGPAVDLPRGATVIGVNGLGLTGLPEVERYISAEMGIVWRYRQALLDLKKSVPEEWEQNGESNFPHARVNITPADRVRYGLREGVPVYFVIVGKEDGYGDLATSLRNEDIFDPFGLPTLLLQLAFKGKREQAANRIIDAWGIELVVLEDMGVVWNKVRNREAHQKDEVEELELRSLYRVSDFVKALESEYTRYFTDLKFKDGEELDPYLSGLVRRGQLELSKPRPTDFLSVTFTEAVEESQEYSDSNQALPNLMQSSLLRIKSLPRPLYLAPALMNRDVPVVDQYKRYCSNLWTSLICTALGRFNARQMDDLVPSSLGNYTILAFRNALRNNLVKFEEATLQKAASMRFSRASEMSLLLSEWTATNKRKELLYGPIYADRLAYVHIQITVGEDDIYNTPSGDYVFTFHANQQNPMELRAKGDTLEEVIETLKRQLDELKFLYKEYTYTRNGQNLITHSWVHRHYDTLGVTVTDNIHEDVIDCAVGPGLTDDGTLCKGASLLPLAATIFNPYVIARDEQLSFMRNLVTLAGFMTGKELDFPGVYYEAARNRTYCSPARPMASVMNNQEVLLSKIAVVYYRFLPDLEEGRIHREQKLFNTMAEAGVWIQNLNIKTDFVGDDGKTRPKAVPDLVLGAAVMDLDLRRREWGPNLPNAKFGTVDSDPKSKARLLIFDRIDPSGDFSVLGLNDQTTREYMQYYIGAIVQGSLPQPGRARSYSMQLLPQNEQVDAIMATLNGYDRMRGLKPAERQKIKRGDYISVNRRALGFAGYDVDLQREVYIGYLGMVHQVTEEGEAENEYDVQLKDSFPLIKEKIEALGIAWRASIWVAAVFKYFSGFFDRGKAPAGLGASREAARLARVATAVRGERAGRSFQKKPGQDLRGIVGSVPSRVVGWAFNLTRVIKDMELAPVTAAISSEPKSKEQMVNEALRLYAIPDFTVDENGTKVPLNRPDRLALLRMAIQGRDSITEEDLEDFVPSPRLLPVPAGADESPKAPEEDLFVQMNPGKKLRYRERKLMRQNPVSQAYSSYMKEKFARPDTAPVPPAPVEESDPEQFVSYDGSATVFPRGGKTSDYELGAYGARLASRPIVRFRDRPDLDSSDIAVTSQNEAAWKAQQGLSLEEARGIAKRQQATHDQRRHRSVAVPASSALCAEHRSPKLRAYNLPDELETAGGPGVAERKVVLWISPNDIGLPRIMMVRRNVHIDCDFVERPQGKNRAQLLALALQDVLLWISEKPLKRAYNTHVYVGQVGNKTLRLALKPGDPLTFERMIFHLKSQEGAIELANTYDGNFDVNSYQKAVEYSRRERLARQGVIAEEVVEAPSSPSSLPPVAPPPPPVESEVPPVSTPSEEAPAAQVETTTAPPVVVAAREVAAEAMTSEAGRLGPSGEDLKYRVDASPEQLTLAEAQLEEKRLDMAIAGRRRGGAQPRGQDVTRLAAVKARIAALTQGSSATSNPLIGKLLKALGRR